MIKNLMQKREQEEGFTLVELLAVIVILGILSAVAVFAVGGITDEGDKAACEATAKSVEAASEAYRAKNKEYAHVLVAAAIDNPDTETVNETKGLSPDFVRLDSGDTSISGNVITTTGGAVTYTPATGAVTESCA